MKFNDSIGVDAEGQYIQITPEDGRFAIIDASGQPRFGTVGTLRVARDLRRPSQNLPPLISTEPISQSQAITKVEAGHVEAVFGEATRVKAYEIREGFTVELRNIALAPVGGSKVDYGYQTVDTFPVLSQAGKAVMYEVTENPPAPLE